MVLALCIGLAACPIVLTPEPPECRPQTIEEEDGSSTIILCLWWYELETDDEPSAGGEWDL